MNLLELIKKFSKIAAYKNQHRKISCLLYTNTKVFERNKETTPFIIAQKANKILRNKSNQRDERFVH